MCYTHTHRDHCYTHSCSTSTGMRGLTGATIYWQAARQSHFSFDSFRHDAKFHIVQHYRVSVQNYSFIVLKSVSLSEMELSWALWRHPALGKFLLCNNVTHQKHIFASRFLTHEHHTLLLLLILLFCYYGISCCIVLSKQHKKVRLVYIQPWRGQG